MSDDAARYLRQAKDCLDEAQKATSEADKEAWLKLGQEWLVMATVRRELSINIPAERLALT
ncbi:hypothetical protein N2603_23315 [Bradyrhizobium huanghuaihaiense]|uniref:hypothetical protein n=1 Tax=Bradyrhizobium huanghuaihaiense TaxID=990078 RepID=UPI0021A9811A|nr:hypothetical protein [Bradyrhizobium sp. CB3035]UWU73036.1 hypothetical protein N2603_23315 [Bradyrhizobium sp. CB3035]